MCGWKYIRERNHAMGICYFIDDSQSIFIASERGIRMQVLRIIIEWIDKTNTSAKRIISSLPFFFRVTFFFFQCAWWLNTNTREGWLILDIEYSCVGFFRQPIHRCTCGHLGMGGKWHDTQGTGREKGMNEMGKHARILSSRQLAITQKIGFLLSDNLTGPIRERKRMIEIDSASSITLVS